MNKSVTRRVTTSVAPVRRMVDDANAPKAGKSTISSASQCNMDLATMLNSRLLAVESFLESQNSCEAAGPEKLPPSSVLEVLDTTTDRLNGMVYTMNRLEVLLGMVPSAELSER